MKKLKNKDLDLIIQYLVKYDIKINNDELDLIYPEIFVSDVKTGRRVGQTTGVCRGRYLLSQSGAVRGSPPPSMGCVQSKPRVKRKGLVSQQEDFVVNNNVQVRAKCLSSNSRVWSLSREYLYKKTFELRKDKTVSPLQSPAPAPPTDLTSPLGHKTPAPTPASRHSPPASRPRASIGREDLGELEDIERLGDVWSNRTKWEGFLSWLRSQSEGEDSEGQSLSLERLAIFLELYVDLDQQFRSQPHSEHCLNMVLEIADHREDFFGRERCLKCIDTAMRKTVLLNVKNVKEGKEFPSPAVFVIVYQRVVDRLQELLGSYQNSLLEKQKSDKK